MSNILSIFTIEKFIKTGAHVRIFRKRMVKDRGCGLGVAANTSGDYRLNMGGHIDMNNYEINYVSQLHFQDDVRFYDDGNNNYLNFKWGNAGDGGIRFRDGQGVQHGYIYGDGSGRFGLLDDDGTWAVRIGVDTEPLQLLCNNNAEFYVYDSYTWSPGSSRAPIFYDSNNTAYYFDGSATGDSIRVAGNIVAYYSDERLKDIEGNIDSPLEKVSKLNGFYYTANEKAQQFGYDAKRQVGVSAQEVEAVLPEIVTDAPIGHGYKTVDYSKMVPLLIEAIKEQQQQIDELKAKLGM